MSGAIAIFVKTPGLSPVKTRLAVELGQKNAEAFHLLSASAVAAIAQSTSLQSYYAVAEASAMQNKHWHDLPCVWQGEGGLGERMNQVYQSLLKNHDFVLFVGADVPQMTAVDVLTAAKWLDHEEQARLAFGPSVDGGFWLFGGNCSVARPIWTEITYSVADTGTQFFGKIQGLGEVKILSTLRDVDEIDDLLSLREELSILAKPLPAQRELIDFLQDMPTHFSEKNQQNA